MSLDIVVVIIKMLSQLFIVFKSSKREPVNIDTKIYKMYYKLYVLYFVYYIL